MRADVPGQLFDGLLDVIRRHGAKPVSLDELCQQSDIITMHALLNEETRGLLRAEHFRQMKPTAWVVNTSRGATIHEASLIQALREGWISGACLDVVEKEPAAPDNPFLALQEQLSDRIVEGLETFRKTAEKSAEEAFLALTAATPEDPR